MGCPAAVKAEDKLVEIGLQVRAAEPVIDAECPGFEVGEDAMNPGEDDVGGDVADGDTMGMFSADAILAIAMVGPEHRHPMIASGGSTPRVRFK